MRVSGLFLYPVKSLRGFAVTSAQVDRLGFAGDRRFLVVDATGRFLTQRGTPRMALVSTALSDGFLHLSAQDSGTVSVPAAADASAQLVTVSVWSQEGLLAENCGGEASAWLSHVLQTPCRLVRIGPAFHRPVVRGTALPGDEFSFSDGAPLLVTSTASLDELNHRIAENGGSSVPMDRFRPNIVLEGGAPFAEDTWKHLDISGLRFRTCGPCQRCVVTATDQTTGERGQEPLKTLATFRCDPGAPSSILFGVNLINESKSGLVRLHDQIAVS